MAVFSGNARAGEEFFDYGTPMPCDGETVCEYEVGECEEKIAGSGNEIWKTTLKVKHPVNGARPGALVQDSTLVIGRDRIYQFLASCNPGALQAIREAGATGQEVNIPASANVGCRGVCTLTKEEYQGQWRTRIAAYLPKGTRPTPTAAQQSPPSAPSAPAGQPVPPAQFGQAPTGQVPTGAYAAPAGQAVAPGVGQQAYPTHQVAPGQPGHPANPTATPF